MQLPSLYILGWYDRAYSSRLPTRIHLHCYKCLSLIYSSGKLLFVMDQLIVFYFMFSKIWYNFKVTINNIKEVELKRKQISHAKNYFCKKKLTIVVIMCIESVYSTSFTPSIDVLCLYKTFVLGLWYEICQWKWLFVVKSIMAR